MSQETKIENPPISKAMSTKTKWEVQYFDGGKWKYWIFHPSVEVAIKSRDIYAKEFPKKHFRIVEITTTEKVLDL